MKALKKKKQGKTYRHVGRILAIILAVAVLAVGYYANDYYHAAETAVAALKNTSAIDVEVDEKDGVITFMPENPMAGIIFYPGGKVEYTAYAPLLKKFAEQGVACVLIEMPMNLAVLDVDAADGIKEQYSEIDTWYMAGHSLGGAMAASYVAEHTGDYAGLILLGAYSEANLFESGLQVISLYGSEDKILDVEKYEELKTNLPETTSCMVLGGGCHSYFGDYGMQEGDGEPTLTMEQQIDSTVSYAVKQMKYAAK